VRVLVNFMLRKDTWFVHAITEDARTLISPILEVREQDTLIRLLRYIGAGDAEIDHVLEDIRRWSRGGVWIELEPGGRTCSASVRRGASGRAWRDEAGKIHSQPAYTGRHRRRAEISADGDAMTGNASVGKTGAETPKAKIWTFANILLMTMILGVWLGGTFAAAGTVRWIRGWICIAATLVMYAVGTLAVRLKNPALLAAASQLG
jgi:hypothetical protein